MEKEKIIAIVRSAEPEPYLKARMVGAGIGGKLANRGWIEEGRYDRITEAARVLAEAVRNVRQQ